MSKSKRSIESDKEKDAENHNHKARRQHKRLEAELARTVIEDEDIDNLYDQDIPQFQKIKRTK